MYSILFFVVLHVLQSPVINDDDDAHDTIVMREYVVECDTDADCMLKNPAVDF